MVDLIGPRLRLRPVVPGDATDTYAGWMNDPDVVRYTESRYVSHTPESLRAFIETVIKSQSDLFLAITLKQDARHIGNIKLGNMNIRHGSADTGIIIGEKDCWGKGYASEAIGLLADHAFEALGLHKLTAGCYAVNGGSAQAFEYAGFEIEGMLKSQCISDGERVDVVLLGRSQAGGG